MAIEATIVAPHIEQQTANALGIFEYARLVHRITDQTIAVKPPLSFHDAIASQLPELMPDMDLDKLAITAAYLAGCQREHLSIKSDGSKADEERRTLLLEAVETVNLGRLDATVEAHRRLIAGVRFDAHPDLAVAQSVLATEERQRMRTAGIL